MKLLLASLLLLAAVTVAPAASTNAITRGLVWLAAQQQANGAWSTNTALNALPALAILSAGHEPGVAPHGDRVEKAVRFILSQQDQDGGFTNNGALMFGQGMTTLLLAEMTGMSKEGPKLRTHLERAVRFILKAQAVEKGDIHRGGWRYFADSTDSDLAVSIWQIAALRAALSAGIRVPQAALDSAAQYVGRCQRSDGGFAYQPGGFANAGRTAAGLIALRMCNGSEPATVARAKTWLAAHPLKWDDDYFYHSAFFCAQAGLPYDETTLLARQQPDGSWPAPPHCLDETEAGPLYRTALAIMALTARDHYLPVFTVND